MNEYFKIVRNDAYQIDKKLENITLLDKDSRYMTFISNTMKMLGMVCIEDIEKCSDILYGKLSKDMRLADILRYSSINLIILAYRVEERALINALTDFILGLQYYVRESEREKVFLV
jgi:hypothetical protein